MTDDSMGAGKYPVTPDADDTPETLPPGLDTDEPDEDGDDQ